MADIDTDKLNEKLARWVFQQVEMREGYWDECGDFTEMQSNPYSHSHSEKALCYLVESRDLSPKELEIYTANFQAKQAYFIPKMFEYWELVPDLVHSLDAQKEHIYPKLPMFSIIKDARGYRVIILAFALKELKTWGESHYDADLAVACALAVEKMIDGK